MKRIALVLGGALLAVVLGWVALVWRLGDREPHGGYPWMR